jgi:hypothetical protein
MSCTSINTKRPIDAFIKYFLDVKPYHTKILEVIERYSFREDLNIVLGEELLQTIQIKNIPLCKPVGFGLDFDQSCGFDALSCCDLFTCIGGYGLVFDNSDLHYQENIIFTQNNTVVVSGDYRYDKYFNISSIPNNSTILIDGDITTEFANPHEIFLIVPETIYNINEIISNNSFTIQGNVAAHFIQKVEFLLFNSGTNDGKYGLVSALYDIVNDITTITVASDTLDAAYTGTVRIPQNNKNNGVYQVNSISFNGSQTVIQVNSYKSLDYTDAESQVYGSIVLRRGLLQNRYLTIENSAEFNDGDWRILETSYDFDLNRTTIVLDKQLEDTVGYGNISLYGYLFGSGFDGFEECSIPKPANIQAHFAESLFITIESGNPVSPTPAP